jgi:hypothetical protein
VGRGESTFCARRDDFDSSKAKYKNKEIILPARDPKDVAASAYFHKSKREKTSFNRSFSGFFRDEQMQSGWLLRAFL